MVAEPIRTVRLDFSIESRDLFRASLSLAKIRLLIGLAISAGLISGLVYFFILIDEKVILLKTSPLFVALPLMAVGGQVLRMHATCRKYVRSLSGEQRRLRFTFCSGSDGYDLRSGESFSHISWKDVLKIVEQPASVLIFLSRYDLQIIPKRGFNDASDLLTLRQILLSSAGRKAKLLESPN